uniref:Anaphase-promoting complex subunit 4 WD40 domain-containing protein n=1 Tax=Pseudictyota dubia TaxID=2749911 RepID=A0A7R9ZGR7_9STRA
MKQERVLEGGHLKPVHSVRLSSDHLASADVRDVCVWNIGDSYAPIIGKSRWCFHTQRIVCLAWSEDGSVLASGGNDDSIYLWSMTKKTKRVHYSFAHRGGISGLEFMKAGDGNGTMTLVSVGADGCINAWDVADDVAKKFG